MGGDNLVSIVRATFRSHVMVPTYSKGHRIIILSGSGEGSAKKRSKR